MSKYPTEYYLFNLLYNREENTLYVWDMTQLGSKHRYSDVISTVNEHPHVRVFNIFKMLDLFYKYYLK